MAVPKSGIRSPELGTIRPWNISQTTKSSPKVGSLARRIGAFGISSAGSYYRRPRPGISRPLPFLSTLLRMASDILCLCAADFATPFNASEIFLRCSSGMGPMRLSLFHALLPFSDSDNFFRCSSDIGSRLRPGIGVGTTGPFLCPPGFIMTELKPCPP